MNKFYGHFAAAYGTCWLVIVVLAVVTASSIQTGSFGLYGFPIIALLYAFIRMNTEPASAETQRIRAAVERIESRLDGESTP